ncbi:heterokaryon incompatibility, partial [Lasiosphaeria hispida]
PIQCQLFKYPLQEPDQGAYLYKALSYMWGSKEDNQPIYIQEPDGKGNTFLTPHCLYITQNLYAALLHIQNHFLDHVLWVDAIYINQEDNKEKEQQVQSMAKIYASTNHIIVWLREVSSNTDKVFEAL